MHTANIFLSPALIAKMVRCIEDAVGDDIRADIRQHDLQTKNSVPSRIWDLLNTNIIKTLDTEEAQGKIWICKVPDERKAREVEQKYRITSKQYVEGGLQLRVISEIQPELECMSIPATLEDAYIYVTNQYE